MQTTIATVLSKKGHDVWSLPPAASVSEALQMMAQKHIEAVLVMSDDRLVGIISQRDSSRVVLQGGDSGETPISEAMTSPVVFVSSKHTVGDCMWIMTEELIGHLPVVDDERLVGVVSSGDLLKSIVTTQGETIDHLRGYITGKYPG